MSSSLERSAVMVTGAARGLGRALAIEAARRGAAVLVADVTEPAATAAAIEQLGGRVHASVADITDYAAVERLAELTVERFGGVNVLVNNAATAVAGGLQDADPAQARRTFEVNIVGTFNCIRAFYSGLAAAAERGEPAFVLNVGSEHSLGVPPHAPPTSVYTTTKYAILGLTDCARRDFAGTGVGVSMLAPGWILTERVRAAMEQSPEIAAMAGPTGQEPEHVAKAAFDGLLAGTTVIPTNPVSRRFALEHAYDLIADIQALPLVDDAGEAAGREPR